MGKRPLEKIIFREIKRDKFQVNEKNPPSRRNRSPYFHSVFKILQGAAWV